MTEYQTEVLKIINDLNKAYNETLEDYLVGIYHKVLNDSITLDDVCDIGEKHGLDIENEYNQRVSQLEDEDD